ncbi:MAG: DoxX family protein [Bacteroidota bacterium]
MLKTLTQLEKWGDAPHPVWLDLLRAILGIFLFFKGAGFIADTEASSALIQGLNFNIWSVGIIHYVAFAHIFGGILIAIGCLTRIAVLFQIPVLLGAVFFANIRSGFSGINSEFWLSVFTLFLLILFLIIGSGKLSFDNYLKNNQIVKL